MSSKIEYFLLTRVGLVLILLTGVMRASPVLASSSAQVTSTTPLLLSLTNNQTVGGISAADEDILQFNGQSWEMFFDGSDVGLSTTDVFAFSVLDPDSLLLSFSSAVTVNGVSVAIQDVVRFDATSLGTNTAGTFSMWLDGSDVGLSTSGESIDAITLLNDGRILVSTSGNSSVVGVSGMDEDVLAFLPVSLGDITSGTWSLYFDGSDAGLADTNDEDVDALDVTSDGTLYLSTLGNFAVGGIAGADEDVFVCVPTAIGDVTSCNYSSTLYFDGSVWGLSSNDVDAVHVSASVGISTPVVTATATRTQTPSATSTVTPTQTLHPTVTSTLIPTATSTATDTAVPTFTSTLLPAATDTVSPTGTPVADTPTFTAIPVVTNTPVPLMTDTVVPGITATPLPTNTAVQTFTATVEPTGTTVSPSETPAPPAMGPLMVSTVNPRYFSDPSGKIVYLTGSHTWCVFMDCDDTPTVVAKFDYHRYLDFLEANNHNFFRLWRAENSRGGEAGTNFWFDPMPYQRSMTCCAFDGSNKFDLSQFNQYYFDRMRARVIEAREHGMYVAILLFDGWSVESKFGGHEPWPGHPFNIINNINGVDGDMNDDNQGGETHTLAMPEITALQEAYVRKVIDTVNDLDNVLYEISNESPSNSEAWQYHMINVVRSYEATKPFSHPVGMTWEWPGGDNTDLYNSPADWISLGGNVDLNTYVPPASDGAKIILADTDHLCGICGTRQWVWKSFTRGENPIFMDIYDNATSGRGMPFTNPAEAEIRVSMGQTRAYASRMNIAAMSPQPALCSTGYCLANASAVNAEYLAFLPNGGTISMDLSAAQGSLTVEWFNPVAGVKFNGGSVNGGAVRQFTPPFGGDAVLYLYSTSMVTLTPSPIPSLTATSVPTNTPLPAHTPTDVPACTSTVEPEDTPTLLPTQTPSLISTNTPVPTETLAALPTYTDLPVSTSTSVPTNTALPTATFTKTATQTLLPTSTLTRTPTLTVTASRTPTTTSVGSYPRTGILDTFDRTNGTIGSSWSGFSSAFRIVSNQLDVTSTGWDTYILWNSTSFGANQEAFVTLSQLDTNSSNEHSLVLKSQSASSSASGLLYVLYNYGSKTVQVWTYHPSQGWVQQGANISVTFVNGDQFGARALANGSVEIYRNGTLIGTRSITAWPYYANGGYIGLWFAAAPNALADNFGGGTVP